MMKVLGVALATLPFAILMAMIVGAVAAKHGWKVTLLAIAAIIATGCCVMGGLALMNA